MKNNKSYLAQGNEAFRNKEYEKALELYLTAQNTYPELKHLIEKNIESVRKYLNLITPKSEISNPITIDIVVPVFNALEDVKKCLQSLYESTDELKVKVIVVNDGSDVETSSWLREYCDVKPIFQLIENPKNLGYTKTVNVGLRASTAEFVITQNSDTIVSTGWLLGLVRCMSSSSKIGICGPLSNAASWQNVPNLYNDSGVFAVNDLPENFTVANMAEVISSASAKIYPRMPFVNGFCFMIKRSVIDAIGYMDEENFPIGYGEENDYCIRALDAGYELAIADDVYVFHAKSKSFGHDKRKELSKNGTESLKRKHTVEKYTDLVNKVKNTVILDEVRSRVRHHLLQPKKNVEAVEQSGMCILFLLPVKGGGGGAHSVVQEVTAMRKLGLIAHVGVKHEQISGFLQNYSDIPNSADLFVSFDDYSILDLANNYDVVVGTIFSSMELVKRISDAYPHILPAYYVQDYEPMFFESGSKLWQQAYDSYTLVPNTFLFAKTQWIIQKVKEEHNVKVHKVSPSIDHEVYKLAPRVIDSCIHIAAMIRPQTPRRGADRTMRVLEKLYKTYENKLKIHLFGCSEDAEEFQALERNFSYTNYGSLKRPEVAALLGKCDLFIDLSDYQAFGRTALEAMACGSTAVVPVHGGADEYAIHGENAFIVDSLDEDECFNVIHQALSDSNTLHLIKNNSLLTASRYSVHSAAVSEYVALSKVLFEHRKVFPIINKSNLFLLPSKRNATDYHRNGHVRVTLPYRSATVRKNWNVQLVTELPNTNNQDVVLIQRDASNINIEDLISWYPTLKKSGARLIYELNDDLLNEEGLRERGFLINEQAFTEKVLFLAKSADLITVPNKYLAEKFKTINPATKVLPNILDGDLWKLNIARDHSIGTYARKHNDPVRIGYFGTSSHGADLDMIAPAMKAIQKKYGDKVEIEVIGGFQNRPPSFGKRVGLPKKNDYPSFVNWLLQRVHWDIGLIPLVEDEFNKYKSNLKFLEYAALDMAIVVSDLDIYSDVAMDNHNCLIAKNSVESWIAKITSLIEDADTRKQLASNARIQIIDKFTLKHNSHLYQSVLSTKGVFSDGL